MVECVERYRNKAGAIIKYRLINNANGTSVIVTAEDLRKQMMGGLIVSNLKLSKSCAILMKNPATEKDRIADFCIQCKESISDYKEMIAPEKRELTNEEKVALAKLKGFYVGLDEGCDSVDNLKNRLLAAIKDDLDDYIDCPFRGKLQYVFDKAHGVDKESAEIESALNETILEYQYVVNAIVKDNYGFSKQYRVIFNIK